MKVCFVTSECVPFAKTGGLADVSGSLPPALAELGCEVKLFMPLYGSIPVIDHGFVFAPELRDLPVPVGGRSARVNVWYGKLPGTDVEVYLVDSPHYFHRGGLYTNDPDEDERFLVLQHAAFAVMQRYAWSPDVIHANDWQAALMPVFLRTSYGWDDLFSGTASLLSIHNIGYQGLFGPHGVHKAGLTYDLFHDGGPLSHNGAFSFLKAGILFASTISTVSETYAHEIQSERHGAGLDAVLRHRGSDLFGIRNGIDTSAWNPASDPHIAANYTADTLDDKLLNKQALLERFGLPYEPDVPVLGIISRLTGQKGFDLLQPILGPLIQEEHVQLVVLGSGEPALEDFFNWAQRAFPERVGVYIGYNDPLAHQIEAGADAFLMPSHYEPCGLNQMYSLAYGTVPIVHRTGGLADTVHDWHEMGGHGNGFSFWDATPHALQTTIKRALSLYRTPAAWRELQRRGMEADFSWTGSAEKYLDLYWRSVHRHRGF
jgi:starch synthase